MFDGLDDAYGLTTLQKGMLYETLKHPDTDVYVAYILIDITDDIDKEQLRLAWTATIREHETLRTHFVWEGLDDPLQLVNTNADPAWTVCALPDDDCADVGLSRDEVVDYWLEVERSTPLSLSDAPPMRLRLIQIPEGGSALIWTVHHMLADDWSTPLVLNSVARHYGSHFVALNESACESGALRYSRYVDWHNQSVDDESISWWRSALSSAELTPLTVESDYAYRRTGTHTGRHQRVIHSLNALDSAAIEHAARGIGCTQSTLWHAAWAIALARYTGTSSVLFGTSVSGRSCALPKVEAAVGLFLNTLPTYIDVLPQETIASYLQQVQHQLFEQLVHEHVPLADLLKLPPFAHSKQMFETVLVVEAHGADVAFPLRDSAATFTNIRYITESNFPLTALIFPGETVQVHLVGSEDVIPGAIMQQLCNEFIAVALDLCSPDSTQLQTILDRQQRRLASVYPAQPLTALPPSARVDNWIQQVAADAVSDLAILDEGVEYTYQQLMDAAKTLASTITLQGVEDSYIGIYLERGFDQIASILGIMLSGNAYVPLDRQWPASRVAMIIADADLACVLSDMSGTQALNALTVRVIRVDEDLPVSADSAGPVGKARVRSDSSPAYMIYTSGSTGKPKGVVVTHRNLALSTAARIQHYTEKPDRYLLLSTYSFDSSVAGIFWTLCTGGTLVLPGSAQALDIHEIETQIARHQVTHTLCLPSLYHLLLRFSSRQKLTSLALVIVAGEACPAQLPALHQQMLPTVKLANEYGPTEATVWCTSAWLTLDQPAQYLGVPIGTSAPGVTVQVVDESGQHCPMGVSGELLISGPTVAAGYHGDTTLTSRRFSPLSGGVGQAVYETSYRSGDQAVLGADGQFYYLGRRDSQFKIRGSRIEAGEIESRVLAHPAVSEVYCCVQSDGTDADDELVSDFLVCFYTLTAADYPDSEDKGALALCLSGDSALQEAIESAARERIQKELPQQFSVSRFCALRSFPRLPNGKLDPAGFPQLRDKTGAVESVPTRVNSATPDPSTRLICEILSGLLGGTVVEPADNFFALGGDSLAAIRLVATCREQGIMLSIPMVSEYSSIQEMSDALHLNTSQAAHRATADPWGVTPLTPMQRWFFDAQKRHPDHWNMAFSLQLPALTQRQTVIDAIAATLEHFPVLSSRFDPDSADCRIPRNPDAHQAVRFISTGIETGDDHLHDHLLPLQSEFDLRVGQLCRFLIEEDENGNSRRIGVVIHHLVTDAVSNWLIARHISNQVSQTATVPIPHQTPIPFRDWALHVANASPVSTASASVAMNGISTANWREKTAVEKCVSITAHQLKQLLRNCKGNGVELHEEILHVLVSAMGAKISVRVDVESHGRTSSDTAWDVSDSVGWYTDIFSMDLSSGLDVDSKEFSHAFRQAKSDGAESVATDPSVFFDTDQDAEGFLKKPVLLYNFLAMGYTQGSATHQDDEMVFTPIIDQRLRHPDSVRSHALEILVTDAHDGISIVWRVHDEYIGALKLDAWLASTENLIAERAKPSAGDDSNLREKSVSEEFPDSGMSDDELAQFFSGFD